MFSWNEIQPKFVIQLNTFDADVSRQGIVTYHSQEIENFNGNFEAHTHTHTQKYIQILL